MKNSPVTDNLLQAHEPHPFESISFGDRPIVFSCDHASNRIPASLTNLGLSEADREKHIAWDIGAADVTRQVAEKLKATAILNNYSRLVVDCNRYLSDPSAFVMQSDEVKISGNHNLSELDKAQRAESIYYIYHSAVASALAKHHIDSQTPLLISIHSFTPHLTDNKIRPWHVGILWDKDPRLPTALLQALRKDKDLVVGDNQPYSGKDIADFTVDHHAEKHGFAYVSIEIRQDLISDEQGINEWSNRLVKVFSTLLEDSSLYKQLGEV